MRDLHKIHEKVHLEKPTHGFHFFGCCSWQWDELYFHEVLEGPLSIPDGSGHVYLLWAFGYLELSCMLSFHFHHSVDSGFCVLLGDLWPAEWSVLVLTRDPCVCARAVLPTVRVTGKTVRRTASEAHRISVFQCIYIWPPPPQGIAGSSTGHTEPPCYQWNPHGMNAMSWDPAGGERLQPNVNKEFTSRHIIGAQ